MKVNCHSVFVVVYLFSVVNVLSVAAYSCPLLTHLPRAGHKAIHIKIPFIHTVNTASIHNIYAFANDSWQRCPLSIIHFGSISSCVYRLS